MGAEQNWRIRMFMDELAKGSMPTKKKLAPSLEVSEATLQRDIYYMKHTLNIPMEYDKKNHGWFLTDKSFKLEAMQISEKELFALFVVGQITQQYKGTSLYPTLMKLTKKIEASSIEEKAAIPIQWFKEALVAGQQPARHINKKTWDTIIKALKQNKKVTIHYKKVGATTPEVRTIIPARMMVNQGNWYLISWCLKKKDVRNFSINRIAKITMVKEKSVTDEKLQKKIETLIEKYTKNQFGVFLGAEDHAIKLSFSKLHGQFIKETEWQEGYEITEAKNGRVTLSFHSNNLIEVTKWVLSFGSHVKIIEPPELKEIVKNELTKAMKQY